MKTMGSPIYSPDYKVTEISSYCIESFKKICLSQHIYKLV